MKTITVPNRDQVSPASQEIFDTLKKKIGKVPNLYATFGYSASSLKALLDFEDTVTHSVFTAKEREAIYLVVSQVNQCDYCLAAHSILAGKRGYSNDEILNFRRGIAAAPKLQAAVSLAKAIAETKGLVADATKDAFLEAGYDEAALVDLAALVSLRTFTNYIYALTKIPVDFPAVEKI
jgi:uncharacterized peroxidase-related enzyme